MASPAGAFVVPVPIVLNTGHFCNAMPVIPMFSRGASALSVSRFRSHSLYYHPRTTMTPMAMARGSQSMGGDEDSIGAGPSKSELNMMRKNQIVSSVSTQLKKADMLFSVPLSGISVKGIYNLRENLPEGVKVMAVKNSLMRRALEGTEWSVAGDLVRGSNLWFFVNEENIRSTIVEFEKFNKEFKENTITGGVLEGVVYDTEGVLQIGKLPSKKELYRQIAVAVKGVPTKVARVTKEIPSKLARAIKLAIVDEKAGEQTAENGSA